MLVIPVLVCVCLFILSIIVGNRIDAEFFGNVRRRDVGVAAIDERGVIWYRSFMRVGSSNIMSSLRHLILDDPSVREVWEYSKSYGCSRDAMINVGSEVFVIAFQPANFSIYGRSVTIVSVHKEDCENSEAVREGAVTRQTNDKIYMLKTLEHCRMNLLDSGNVGVFACSNDESMRIMFVSNVLLDSLSAIFGYAVTADSISGFSLNILASAKSGAADSFWEAIKQHIIRFKRLMRNNEHPHRKFFTTRVLIYCADGTGRSLRLSSCIENHKSGVSQDDSLIVFVRDENYEAVCEEYGDFVKMIKELSSGMPVPTAVFYSKEDCVCTFFNSSYADNFCAGFKPGDVVDQASFEEDTPYYQVCDAHEEPFSDGTDEDMDAASSAKIRKMMGDNARCINILYAFGAKIILGCVIRIDNVSMLDARGFYRRFCNKLDAMAANGIGSESGILASGGRLPSAMYLETIRDYINEACEAGQNLCISLYYRSDESSAFCLLMRCCGIGFKGSDLHGENSGNILLHISAEAGEKLNGSGFVNCSELNEELGGSFFESCPHAKYAASIKNIHSSVFGLIVIEQSGNMDVSVQSYEIDRLCFLSCVVSWCLRLYEYECEIEKEACEFRTIMNNVRGAAAVGMPDGKIIALSESAESGNLPYLEGIDFSRLISEYSSLCAKSEGTYSDVISVNGRYCYLSFNQLNGLETLLGSKESVPVLCSVVPDDGQKAYDRNMEYLELLSSHSKLPFALHCFCGTAHKAVKVSKAYSDILDESHEHWQGYIPDNIASGVAEHLQNTAGSGNKVKFARERFSDVIDCLDEDGSIEYTERIFFRDRKNGDAFIKRIFMPLDAKTASLFGEEGIAVLEFLVDVSDNVRRISCAGIIASAASTDMVKHADEAVFRRSLTDIMDVLGELAGCDFIGLVGREAKPLLFPGSKGLQMFKSRRGISCDERECSGVSNVLAFESLLRSGSTLLSVHVTEECEEMRSLRSLFNIFLSDWSCVSIIMEGGIEICLAIGYSMKRSVSTNVRSRLMAKFYQILRFFLNYRLVFVRMQNSMSDYKSVYEREMQLISQADHALRQPLNVVISSAEILSHQNPESPFPKEVRDKWIGNIRTYGGALLCLVNDILNFSKLRTGNMKFLASPINLYGFFSEVSEPFRRQAEEKGLSFELNVDTQAVILASSQRLKDVIDNLLSNAVKFTSEGSVKVYVRIESEESDTAGGAGKKLCRLLFSVSDTGCGIPDKYIDKIYDPFASQGCWGGIFGNYIGTGLGLAICKTTLGFMNGTINCRKNPDSEKGTIFDVEIPGLELWRSAEEVR